VTADDPVGEAMNGAIGMALSLCACFGVLAPGIPPESAIARSLRLFLPPKVNTSRHYNPTSRQVCEPILTSRILEPTIYFTVSAPYYP
jgi:hypothetical protein